MARHANVSRATIYSRVANKEELIEAVIRPHDHRRAVSSVRVTVDQGSFDRFRHAPGCGLWILQKPFPKSSEQLSRTRVVRKADVAQTK
ncbi:hypothetical protein DOU54_25860 [Agrobacterium sp. MS2]|nr:hypothetical protein DOU54_25860 [Agrobacterium sp. MS2]